MTSTLRHKLWLWWNVLLVAVMIIPRMVRAIFKAGVTKYFHWEKTDRPAILDDPVYGEHGYLHLEGVRIHFVASGPTDKPLMLLLHGYPEFWFSWRHQIKEFQRDYRVVAVDMRGYGDSDKPKGMHAYALEALLKDVKQTVVSLGYKSCVLVAHDWGGAIAWIVGKVYPEIVDKLILINTPRMDIFFNLLHNNSAQRKKSWYMFFYQLPWLPELFMKSNDFVILKQMLGLKNEDEWKAYKHVYSQPGALTPPINYYRALLQQVGGKLEVDINYTMPVILLWGVQDRALDVSNPKEVQKANPAITVKYIEEAGHFVHHVAPNIVNRLIREWLADVE